MAERVDKGRAVGIFCPDFCKDFDNVSHNILIGSGNVGGMNGQWDGSRTGWMADVRKSWPAE